MRCSWKVAAESEKKNHPDPECSYICLIIKITRGDSPCIDAACALCAVFHRYTARWHREINLRIWLHLLAVFCETKKKSSAWIFRHRRISASIDDFAERKSSKSVPNDTFISLYNFTIWCRFLQERISFELRIGKKVNVNFCRKKFLFKAVKSELLKSPNLFQE